jgi:hypothetical protein
MHEHESNDDYTCKRGAAARKDPIEMVEGGIAEQRIRGIWKESC